MTPDVPKAWLDAANAAIEANIDDHGVSLTDEAIAVIITAVRPLIETQLRQQITDTIRQLKADYKDNIRAWEALSWAQTIARGDRVELRDTTVQEAKQ